MRLSVNSTVREKQQSAMDCECQLLSGPATGSSKSGSNKCGFVGLLGFQDQSD